MSDKHKLAFLTKILGGSYPIAEGAKLFAKDVVFHIDGMTFVGINEWANWIHYIRTRGRVADAHVHVEGIECQQDGTYLLEAHWFGVRRGRLEFSKLGKARYRFENGRIVEVWSTRHNYAFLLGRHVNSFIGWVVELLRCEVWKHVAPQFDLAGGMK